MTFKTNVKIARGRLDPTPMVDIMFLLLIFLAVSSPLVLQPGFGAIELPVSSGSNAVTWQGLVLMVKDESHMFFNLTPVKMEELKLRLKTEAQKIHNPELIIKADRQVTHETLIKIMNIAFEAGIPAVNLATRPELPSELKPPR